MQSLEWLAWAFRRDVEMCNLIGTKQCDTCHRHKVPDMPNRTQCMACIKTAALQEANIDQTK